MLSCINIFVFDKDDKFEFDSLWWRNIATITEKKIVYTNKSFTLYITNNVKGFSFMVFGGTKKRF